MLLPTRIVILAALSCFAMSTFADSIPLPHSPHAEGIEKAPDLHDLIQEFQADQNVLSRRYAVSSSANTRARFDRLYADWEARLKTVPATQLGSAGKADAFLFENYLSHARHQLTTDAEVQGKLRHLVPFADSIIELEEARVRMDSLEPAQTAQKLTDLAKSVEEARKRIEADSPAKEYGFSAVELFKELRRIADHWFRYYHGYDPLFSWWNDAPYKELDKNLAAFEETLQEKTLGKKGEVSAAIVGRAVGRQALVEDLAAEMVPYSPEELIAIGEKEYVWCEAQMKEASRELGYGDDWKKALEHVKQQYVEPGKQTALIRNLALEAIDFVESKKLVTVPPLAKETWRMEMMTPEAQLVNPFFLGGESIIVSYPTDTMTQEQKRMSMRGNNPYFSRATVQHELIPGHHLQGFMEERYRPYRQLFWTPFWVEGWALYWEMLLWDRGFPRTPEEKIGMLFWRMHRCVRIVFSLKFHLGQMTPEECVNMLVDRVGHERANAEGEVRRSFNGSYPPLYQAAYMVGGLQIRALHHELVDSGKMDEIHFHDAILHENIMPIAALRGILAGLPMNRESLASWRFYDEDPQPRDGAMKP